MIRKHLKLLIITSVIILLPIAVGIVLWKQLPTQMPIHWNAAGDVDGWCGKPFFVFGFPLILLAFQWLCVVGTGADPKRENHQRKILQLVFWIIPVLSWLLHAITYATAFGKAIEIEVLIPVFMGLLFAVIGNYLPKCKQSYTIGIKLPWTLHSEENWNRTHRLAGWLWMVCGIIIALLGLFNLFGIAYLFFSVVLVMVLVPFIYSYILHRKGI